MIPFLDRLDGVQRVLIAGCGGGFDVYAGVPLAMHLLRAGKQLVFANLSFTNLAISGAQQISPVLWRIDPVSSELPYFPERWLCEWLQRQSIAAPVYAFAKSGVDPLAAAYRQLVAEHDPDLVLLVDGGTDSLIFGDEPGLGTIVEDAVSLVAAHEAAGDDVLLAALGFGVDHFHGVSHHAFLENAARMIRDGGHLGCVSVSRGTPGGDALLDLIDYANARQPLHRSIVGNSIVSAMRGEFGDYHATDRTGGAALFVNPLMAQYWTFSAAHVVARMRFADGLRGTQSFGEASAVIERVRETLPIRARQPIPL